MEVHLGSSILRGTDGRLIIDGDEQIVLEIGEHDGALLVSIDLYDANSKHVAKLRRNVWAFHDANQFDAGTRHDEKDIRVFGIQDKASKQIVLSGAAFSDPQLVIIKEAHFRTKTGQPVDIDQNGDIRMTGATIRRALIVGGGPMKLDGGSLSLG